MTTNSYKRSISALNEEQKDYFRAIKEYDIVIGTGVAGVGKTFVPTCEASKYFLDGTISKIVLTRPAVTTEKFGFLPGEIEDKMDPFMRPLFDILDDRLGHKRIKDAIEHGTIEIAPIAYLRGRTINSAFIIFDEAQNSTVEQMKMFITRLGEDVKCVITGDLEQSDIPGPNGLQWIVGKLENCPYVKIINLLTVVRSDLLKNIMPYLGEENGNQPSRVK